MSHLPPAQDIPYTWQPSLRPYPIPPNRLTIKPAQGPNGSREAHPTQPPDHSMLYTCNPHFNAALSHPQKPHRDPMDHEKRMLEGR